MISMKRVSLILLILIIIFGCSRTPEDSSFSKNQNNNNPQQEDNSPPTIDSIIYPTNNSIINVFTDLMFNITASDDINIKNLYVIIDNQTNTYSINSKTINYKNYLILKNSMQGNKTIKFLLEDAAGKKSDVKPVHVNIIPSSIDWDYKESFNDLLPSDIKVNYRDGTYQNTIYSVRWNYTQVRNDGGSNVDSVYPYYTNPESISNTPLLPTPVIRNSNIAILYTDAISGGISKLYFQYYQPFATALNFKLIISGEDTNTKLFETNVVKATDRWNLREFGPINLSINQNFRIIFIQNGGGQLAIDNIRWTKFDGSTTSSSASSISSSLVSSSSSFSSSASSLSSSSFSSSASSLYSSSSSSSVSSTTSIIFYEDFASLNPSSISTTYTNGIFTNTTYSVLWEYTQVRNDGGTTGTGSTNYTNINNIPNPPALPTPVLRNTNITILISSGIPIPEPGLHSIYFQYYQPFSTGLNFIFQLTTSDTNDILYQTNIAVTNRPPLFELGPVQININSPQIRLIFRQKGGGQAAIDNIILRKE